MADDSAKGARNSTYSYGICLSGQSVRSEPRFLHRLRDKFEKTSRASTHRDREFKAITPITAQVLFFFSETKGEEEEGRKDTLGFLPIYTQPRRQTQTVHSITCRHGNHYRVTFIPLVCVNICSSLDVICITRALFCCTGCGGGGWQSIRIRHWGLRPQ